MNVIKKLLGVLAVVMLCLAPLQGVQAWSGDGCGYRCGYYWPYNNGVQVYHYGYSHGHHYGHHRGHHYGHYRYHSARGCRTCRPVGVVIPRLTLGVVTIGAIRNPPPPCW